MPEDDVPARGPVDSELLDRIAAHLARSARFEDVQTRPAFAPNAVVGNETDDVRVNAIMNSDGSYEASVPTDELSPGSYALFATVRGPNEASSGEQEALGVSDRQDVTVESTATPTPTATQSSNTDTGGSSGGGGGSSGGGGGSMTTTTLRSTATPTPNSTLNGTATSQTPTPTTTPMPTTTDTTAPPSPTPTDDDVVTPATTSADGGPATETGGQSGFGAIVGTVALLAGALLLTRRRREN